MEPKPEFLGRQFAASFEDASVAAAYRYRPPFPPQTFEVLHKLDQDKPSRVLDAGCGTGALARHMVDWAGTVDAVDVSQAMIEQGKRLPNGDHPRLNWILGLVEEAPLTPPYSLITAGCSLHWMDWAMVMPRFARLLSPNGVLVIIEEGSQPPPWQAELRDIFRRFSINRGFQPFQLVDELARRGLYTEQGKLHTDPVSFEQPVEDYIESFHSRSSFSRQRMSAADASAFDQALSDLVRPYAPHTVRLEVYADLSWGIPHIVENQ